VYGVDDYIDAFRLGHWPALRREPGRGLRLEACLKYIRVRTYEFVKLPYHWTAIVVVPEPY